MMKFTNKYKKQLYEKISNMSSTEHEEIFNIILRHDTVNYTSNKNGVFFNLTILPETILEEIDNFVNFCFSNKQDLDDYDKRLNECKVNTNIVNINLGNIVDVSQKYCNNNKVISVLPINNDKSPCNIDAIVDAKHAQKIVTFVEKMYADKATKKKMNVKFHNAKKKYSKKVNLDLKFEHDILGDLQLEEYLLK